MTPIKIDRLNKKFTKYYDAKEEAREQALKLAREISRDSTAIIRRVHSQGNENVPKLMAGLKEINKKYKDLKKLLVPQPELNYSNFVENYLQEYAEVSILLTLIQNNLNITKIPDPDELGLPYTTYILGLSDVIGEFRRCALDELRIKELGKANAYLDAMEELYDIIINLNYPNGVLPVRRKQDVARALIDKTRGELAFLASEFSLEDNISDLKSELSSYYKKVARKN